MDNFFAQFSNLKCCLSKLNYSLSVRGPDPRVPEINASDKNASSKDPSSSPGHLAHRHKDV
jgi:hypothetical protein